MKFRELEGMQINNNLLELISPQGIKLSSNTIQIGENISKYFFIKDYTSTVNLGWLTQILNILGAVVTINITPVDSQEFMASLDKGMQSNIAMFNSTRSEVEKTRAEIGLTQSKDIVEDITVNLSTYVDVSMLIKISAKNEIELEKNCNLLRNKVASLGFKLRVPSFLTEQAFTQNSPFAIQNEEILKISNKRMSLKTLMGGLPFSRNRFYRYIWLSFGI